MNASEQFTSQQSEGHQTVSGLGSSMDWTLAWSGNGLNVSVSDKVQNALGEDAKFIKEIVTVLFGRFSADNMHFGVLGSQAPAFAKKHVQEVEAAKKALAYIREGAKKIEAKIKKTGTKKSGYKLHVESIMADGKEIYSF